MESATTTLAVPEQDLVPITANQRIEALDVVRGFALIGIFLMNIEWFNRPISSLGAGMPRGLTGLDWWASWFVLYFVQGKFWTIFSLLFGMGFAVMLTRAERAGREFKIVYLRRVLALAVFGAAHFILLWEGDILFSYAVGALMLMVVLYGKTIPILIGVAVAIGVAFIPRLGNVGAVAAGLALAGLLAIYLRSGKRVRILCHGIPLFSFLLLLIGSLLTIAAAVFWLLPNGPVEPRLPLSIFGPLLLIAGSLSWKYYEPADKRSVRLAVSVYLFLGIAITAGGLIQQFAPDPDAGVAVAGETATTVAPVDAAAAAKAATGADTKGKEKTKEERAAERKAEGRTARRSESGKHKERRVMTSGSYWEAVKLRGGRFPEKPPMTCFAIVLSACSCSGPGSCVRVSWKTRRASAILSEAGPVWHASWDRAGLLSSLIAMSHTPGDRYDGWGIAVGLSTIGNLPACLGYVGMVVLISIARRCSRVSACWDRWAGWP